MPALIPDLLKVLKRIGMKDAALVPSDSMEEYDVLQSSFNFLIKTTCRNLGALRKFRLIQKAKEVDFNSRRLIKTDILGQVIGVSLSPIAR
jgi:hypothetical protein